MEKKQLFQKDSSLVGFYPNTHIPYFDITINIGDDTLTDNYLFTEQIQLDDNFIDTFNKLDVGDFACLRFNITGNTITAPNTPVFSGYKTTASLYFREATIQNADKNYEKVYIRNINITSIDVEAKTANLEFVHRRIAKGEFTGDGNSFLSNDGTYKAVPQPDLSNYATKVELNNKANTSDVLTKTNRNSYTPTLSYHPATKKYVDDLEIIPEENIIIDVNDNYGSGKITHVFVNGQEIVKVNVTIKYSNIEFKDSILISSDNIDRVSKFVAYNSNDCPCFIVVGTCQTGDGTIGIAVYYTGHFISKEDVLSKTNTTFYTPSADYHPATKKYVDDNVEKVNRIMVSSDEIDKKNIIIVDNTQYDNLTDEQKKYLSSSTHILYFDKCNTYITWHRPFAISYDNSLVGCILCSNNILGIYVDYQYLTRGECYLKFNIKYIQRILTESEYSTLGTIPTTDNVLYFITPD